MCTEPKSLETNGDERWDAGTNRVVGLSAERVRHMISVRKLRAQLISDNAFSDPAWDILLEAFAGSLEEKACATTALCAASGVSESIVKRWIAKLVSDALMEPATKGGSDHYRLTPIGYLAMRNYFETAGPPI